MSFSQENICFKFGSGPMSFSQENICFKFGSGSMSFKVPDPEDQSKILP